MAVVVTDSNILINYKDTSADSRHERAEEIIYRTEKCANGIMNRIPYYESNRSAQSPVPLL